MKRRVSFRSIVTAAWIVFAAFGLAAQDKGPNINERFPIKDPNSLSPPIVSPVGECAKAVHVSGFIPHAIVRVQVNGVQQATAQPYFAEADIALPNPLVLNDKVTATQEVLGITSAPSVNPVVAGAYPALNKPVAGPDLFSCGRIVPVDKLNPGTHVEVFRNGSPTIIGQGDATQTWQPIFTQSLNTGDQVTAVQTACPDLPAKKVTSPTSDPVNVQASPNPPPAPSVEAYPVGADAVVLDGLFVGADVQVLDNGTPAGGGFATAGRNRAPLQPPATAGSHVTATQKLCSTSPPSTSVPPSTTLKAPVLVPPLCEGAHFVTVQGTYPNAIVVLFRNGAIAGMAGGVLGDLKMALGGGAALALGDEVHVIQYVGSVISPHSNSLFANCAPDNVVTQHNDNSRSGSYPAETHLTPVNVNPTTFGKLYSRNVDGDTVSQPLYLRAVHTKLGVKNLFFVTTSKNNIYAFDADNLDTDPTHGLVWQVNLCASLPTGVCGETWSHLVGITSTPVIDPNSGTLYVVARCSNPTVPAGDGAIFIHAINVQDGSDRVKPMQIQATDPSKPSVKFDFHCQRNRPGLLLSKGIVYAAFATFSCDAGCASAPYHGWVLGYRASDLKQVAVFDTSPNAGEAGIWQTGNGLVGADDGSIFFQTGNGPDAEPLQDSFVKLAPTSSPAGLTLAGSFTPNNAATLSGGDTDLGSGGPMLLPHGRLIGGGKQGRYYVLDTGSMGLSQDSALDALGFNGFQAFINTYHNDNSKPACPPAPPAAGCNTGFNGGVCFVDPKQYGNGELCGPNIHGGPIFWQNSATTAIVYEMPEKDFLKGFKYDFATHKVTEAPILTASGSLAKPPTDGMPGGFSSVSSNKMKEGVVWTSMPFGDGQWNPVPGRLAAFDATSLKQLWSDDENVLFAKSVPPTVADGKVIRATAANQVLVYGLLQAGAGAPKSPLPPRMLCDTIAQKYANYGGPIGLLGQSLRPERPVNNAERGRFQDFRGSVFGPARTIASKRQRPDSPMPTCSVPKGETTVVESSIYWTPRTCAHVVQGQIRDLWLRLGGPNSKLGYPISDETLTPDHVGRMSSFEHGEIWWYSDKGASVRQSERPDPDRQEPPRKED
jgi:LGFP repeat